ncbi:MAG: hypothetical protein EOO07_29615 [Chitinophagaceae bacterium]|nr:MAG: hypothetical protein EOO07_29615 [Chitinophagaceae bacterium]
MKRLLIFSLLLSVLLACNNATDKKQPKPTDTVVPKVDSNTVAINTQDSVKAIGRQVLVLLKEKNYTELVKFFAVDGVLFSPYAHIDTTNAKKLMPEDFLMAINKKWILTWGSYDGTGEPIKLSIENYLNKFAYNADYLNAEAVGFNEIIKKGNASSNLQNLYPNTQFIDYHFSGFDQKLNGMDWSSLRLVFEKQNNDYFLVAIIHDQWTI